MATPARLDHSIVITRRPEDAWALFTRLGFTLSPVSRHRVTTTPDGPPVLGCTANRCAYLDGGFVELIGIIDEAAPDPWRVLPLIAGGDGGLRGVSFGLGDSDRVLDRLRDTGLAGSGVLSLERPVGSGVLRARSVHVDRARTPEGIVHSAEHLTPELVRAVPHANGARALTGVLLFADGSEVDSIRDRYATLLDRESRKVDHGRVFDLDGGRLELVVDLDAALPGETPPSSPGFVAQEVGVADVDAARALVEGAGVPTRDVPGGFLVSARETFGAAVLFRSAG
ncbi:hypothetical protein GCM10022243_19240 [Saccharothrix violaceirubra]|uniref:Glyoxalase-like domain-containing protein n=1 Tax=Saccharothrix violaceirubra TaxID=413306 RepID=A0A7W7T257_9PSEU|nr:VOC family protein [Saccharothrix violaceirubra]MBB4965169.1 hypothetical protein [Saccharothrix violaceirubra]